MSQPNPFAQAVAPAEQAPAPQQAPQAAPAANPYAQQQAAPAAPAAAPSNPFGAGVPQQAPAAPQAYAPAPTQQAPANPYAAPGTGAYGPPPGTTHMQHVAMQQQAPAAYAPQQYPQGQQAYAPVQQQAAPAVPPPALDPSMLRGAPAPIVGEGRGAKLAHMYGRLVLTFPLSITTKPRNPQFITQEQRARGDLNQEQITATFVVLDDGQGGMQPIRFGGDPSAFPPVPDNESAPLPYVRKGLWVTQSRVISQLRDFLPDPASGRPGGMVCGRMVKTGPARNDPWYITTANEQELALAGQYMQLVASGTYPHPLA
jgi:hypothetical protein